MNGLSVLQPDSLLSYFVAILFPLLDAVAPIFPSETAVVALGVASAGSIDPRLILLVALAAAGAFIGDNLCFALGRYSGPWVTLRFFASERGMHRLAWAEKTLQRFGSPLIILCRFIPGGRTVVTFTSGAVGYPWHRFAGVSAISGAIWATYAFAIGRVGGTTFSDRPWLGLVVALGLAFALSLIVEAVRRLTKWCGDSLARRWTGSGVDGEQSPAVRASTAGGSARDELREGRDVSGGGGRVFSSKQARHDVNDEGDDHRAEQVGHQGVA